MGTSLKTHHSYVSAIVHRPLLLYSLAKHYVHARFCIVKPRKKYDSVQSSTSMELWVLMDLDLYASDNIGKAQFEKVYWEGESVVVAIMPSRMEVSKGSFILHRNCVAVPMYRLLSAASHRNFNAFQVKITFTTPQCNNIAILCSRGQCSNATQLRRRSYFAAIALRSMNGPLFVFFRS